MAEHTKAELIAELDRARAQLAQNFEGFRRDIDVPTHLKSAIRHNKTAWLTGAAGLGLFLAKMPSRKKKVVYVDRKSNTKVKETAKAGMALGLAKMAFSAAKPALMAFVTKKISDLSRHQGKKEAARQGQTYS